MFSQRLRSLVEGVIADWRYCVTSVVGTLVYYVVTNIPWFTDILGDWYVVIGIGVLLTGLVTFLLQKYWVFRYFDASRIPFQAAGHFVLYFLLTFGNVGGVLVLVEGIGLPPLLSQFALTIASFFFSRWFAKNITFKVYSRS